MPRNFKSFLFGLIFNNNYINYFVYQSVTT